MSQRRKAEVTLIAILMAAGLVLALFYLAVAFVAIPAVLARLTPPVTPSR